MPCSLNTYSLYCLHYLLTCALVHVNVLPSSAVPTWYKSHALSLGFVKLQGQFPLSNCKLSFNEKNAKSAEEIMIINYS